MDHFLIYLFLADNGDGVTLIAVQIITTKSFRETRSFQFINN